ncbi:FkbM family methyltransferase [Thiocapsa marina]|uniref:Methyltransferase FkbM family n=1 Tax=Thiocapsa marina 5811 TaxID=768671 RepID=F9UEY4_9GAMM|nr:FkbM family methyltransferase [Thiocapsa marina]EGV17455.1 methyltransferase FkbM family [Thiocapsa marina 5811]
MTTRIEAVLRESLRQLIPPIVWSVLRGVSLLLKREARERFYEKRALRYLQELPPATPCAITLRGRTIVGIDGGALSNLFREQFYQEFLRFNTAANDPLILDCGANVGMVTLYMKSIFPDARVIAFEPDRDSYAALENNCRGLDGVRTINSAVWVKNEELLFAPAGAVGGYLARLAGACNDGKVIVKAERLRDYLTERVEMLKLDIEGSEIDVLQDCSDRLDLVERMFVEFHSFAGMPQRFSTLLNVIEGAGFRVHVHGSMEEPQPFLEVAVCNRKDLRVNLFCYRVSDRVREVMATSL